MDRKPKKILANVVLLFGIIIMVVHYQNCQGSNDSGLVTPSENTKTCPDGSKIPKTELCPDPGPSVTPSPTYPPGTTPTPSPTPNADGWPTINSDITGFWGALIVKDAVSGEVYTTSQEGNPAVESVANRTAAQAKGYVFFGNANDRVRTICGAHADRTVQITFRIRAYTYDNGTPPKVRLIDDLGSFDSVNIPCSPLPNIGDGTTFSTHSCLVGIVTESSYTSVTQYPGPTVTTTQSVNSYSECYDLLKAKANSLCLGDTTKRVSGHFRYLSLNDRWTKVDKIDNVNAGFNYFGVKCNF